MYIMVAHTYFDHITDKGVIINNNKKKNPKQNKVNSARPIQIQLVNSAQPLKGN